MYDITLIAKVISIIGIVIILIGILIGMYAEIMCQYKKIDESKYEFAMFNIIVVGVSLILIAIAVGAENTAIPIRLASLIGGILLVLSTIAAVMIRHFCKKRG